MTRSIWPGSSLLILGLTTAPGCGDDKTAPLAPADAGIDADSGGPPGPAILSFRASAEVVEAGQAVELSWEVRTATAVAVLAEGPGGPVVLSEGTAASGRVSSGVLAAPSRFRLRASGKGATVEAEVQVDVRLPEVRVVRFSASPNPATPGAQVTLSWETSGATQVRILDRGAPVVQTSSQSGQVQVRGGELPRKIVLEATNPYLRSTASLQLSTLGAARVLGFRVQPPLFPEAAGPVTISWETRGESVRLEANGAPVVQVPPGALSSSVALSLNAPTLYRLVARGQGRTEVARRIAVPGAAAEREPNDDRPRAQVFTGAVLGRLTARDVDVYRLSLSARGHLFVQLTDASGTCAADVGIRLLDATGRELLERDAGERGGCPRIDPFEDPAAAGLAAGDYFLMVDGRVASYEYGLLALSTGSACGDGLVDLSAGEQCDDGDRTGGDGCDASCALEISGTLTLPGPDVLAGGALAAGEVDYFRLVLTASTGVALETGVPAIGQCSGAGADTLLALLDGDFSVRASNDDSLGTCAALSAERLGVLPAGVYYLRVSGFDPSAATPAYEVLARPLGGVCGDGVRDLGEDCDDGNTTDGDSCSARCTAERLQGPMDQVDFDLSPGGLRVVEVEVSTAGQSLSAVTSDGQGGCAVDTRLVLARDGRYLGFSTGGTSCAAFDPRTQAFAADLEPGIYRVLVLGDGSTAGRVRLEVTITDPACGNGIVERRTGETCDDGNLVDGDGCTPLCERVLGGVAMGPGGPPVVFGGSFPNQGGHQRFGIELTAPGNVFVDVGVPVMGQCSGADPVAELLDAQQNVLAFNDDFGDLCPNIDASLDAGARLGPGSYTLLISGFGGSAVPAFEVQIELRPVGCGNFVLEAGEDCDDGNLVPGDGCSELCVLEP